MSRVADLDAKRAPGSRDAEVLVAEATDQIKRLLRCLLLREPQRVRFDLPFDGRTDLRRGPEESVRRDMSVDALVRALEVVVLDEELDASKTVREVSEDRLAQKLVPQRLPEAFDLAEGLGMLWTALAVRDAATTK